MTGLALTMRLTVVFGCLLMGTLAWGQWRTNQRSHPLSVLPANSTVRLCRDFWNADEFKKILKPILVPRVVDTPKHREVGQYMAKFLGDLGFDIEWDEFQDSTPYGRKTFRNLIATYDTKAPRRLVLACHYDSKVLPGETMIAATDSAVPCAMLLDIAKSLVPYMYGRVSKDIALQLLFFDGEEAFVNWSDNDSLYGARHLAKKWEAKWFPSTAGSNFELSREIDRIDVLMLLDLIGAPNPVISNAAGLGATQMFPQLSEIEKEMRRYGCAKIRNVFNPSLSPNMVQDDHVPFMKRGVPILHLITVPFPRFWHTSRDDARTLDYKSIEHITSVVRIFTAKYLGIAPV